MSINKNRTALYIMHINCPKCGRSVGVLHVTNDEAIYHCSTPDCDFETDMTEEIKKLKISKSKIFENS